ncbi:MAG TPA: energy transducer TonB [Methylibium sp.]|uniref:energy transducer TonB n=1 Tax=Methylibium sp. TaxID=2067992 RepID=UPI002DB8BA51|nr:energy transducer TonB [Methylibium sp.]HEU4458499.1 energy transducer TonB [Methylibium sp.]
MTSPVLPTRAFAAPPLPAVLADELPPAARRLAVLGVIAAHLAAGWGLMQVESVRTAVGQMAPLMVELIAPPAPPVPLPPPPPPPLPRVQPKLQKPPPIVTAAPTPAPPVFEAPPPPAEPPAPAVVIEPLPAPPAPPAPPPQPKTIAITSVAYLTPPVLVYPSTSKRLGESGRVLVRVLVDGEGQPRQLTLAQSSGHARLDDSALATVRATRFKPYTENGVPQPFWVVMPLVFELER